MSSSVQSIAGAPAATAVLMAAGAGGEMANRVREMDWSRTPLGPMAQWPPSLRVAAGICLNSRFPMFVWWGPELINIYNDAYVPMLGKRHPEALGRPARASWDDIWDVVGPQADAVMARGEPTWNDRVRLVMERNGYAENTYFTWSYSPIPDDAGGIGGLFCAVTEETQRVRAETERDALLKQAESERARLADAFAQSPAFVAVLRGADHVFEFVNERYYELIGRRGIIGKTVREAIPEVAGQGYFEILDRVYATGKPFIGTSMRILVRRGAGVGITEAYVDFVYQPMRDADGAVVGILVHGVDVTDRRRAEERDQLRLALDDAVRPLVDPAQITATCARMLAEHLGADRCAYADVEDDQDTFNLTGDYNRGVASIVGRYRFADFGGEVLPLMCQEKPYVVTDIEQHQPPVGDLTYYHRAQIRAVICVPLHKAGKFVAAMAVHQTTPREWTQDEVELVRHVASRCWESIERARVERTLRESEERFRAAFDQSVVGIVLTDLQGRVMLANDAFCRMVGYAADELVGRDSRWYTHPDDIDRNVDMIRQVESGATSSAVYEKRYICRDGRTVYAQISLSAVRESNGRTVTLIGVIEDVTERRRAAEAMTRDAALLTNVRDSVIVTDLSGTITYWNEGATRLFGWTAAEMVGRPLSERLPPDARHGVTDWIRRIAAGDGEFEGEWPDYRKDGSRVWIEATTRLARGTSGEPIGIIGVSRDISQRKEAEDELRKAKESAEAASRAKDEFLAVLSHELRTPLTPVLLTASLLESSALLPDALRGDVATIRQNVELESRLISDLLDLTRIAKGKLQLDEQDVDLHLIVRSAIDICQREASARLVTDLHAKRRTVRGDSTRLQQIFWNLINNAIKFTGDDGTITVRSSDHPGGRVRVEVSDTGAGIDAEVLPKLFNAFEQGEVRTGQRFAGLGLGLAISKKLVEAHGGTIAAHSPGRGRGATFIVELPTRDVSAPVAAPQRPAGTPEATRPLAVLLVEDHAPTLTVMTKLLRTLGHRVTGATSVASATAAARQDRFDLIISDLGLPDGSGLDVMRELRKQYAGRAIALTGYGMESDITASQEAGFTEHLTKPVDVAALEAAIRRVGGGVA